MKPFLKKALSEYGMILVLLLLCAYFSVVTWSDQSPAGADGAQQVTEAIARLGGTTMGTTWSVSLVAPRQRDLHRRRLSLQPMRAAACLRALSRAR
jgi:hypothetical protein